MTPKLPVTDTTYATFWRRLARWLVDDVPDKVMLTMTQDRVDPGQPMKLTAEVLDPQYNGINDARVVATVTSPSGKTTEVPLEWTVEHDGEYRSSVVPDEEGLYTVRLAASRESKDLGSATAFVRSTSADNEYFDATMRAPLLRRIAEETGGRFYTNDVSSLPEAISYSGRGVTVVEERDLWDMPAILLLLIGDDRRRMGVSPRAGVDLTPRRPPSAPRTAAARRAIGALVRVSREHAASRSSRWPRWFACCRRCCCLCAVPRAAAAQDTHLLVITGVEGDAEHGAQFHKWASALIDAAQKKGGLADATVTYLADKVERDPARIRGRSTSENVRKAFADLAAQVRPSDEVFIVLFGHGSYDGRQSAFNLPGPDLTVPDYAALLDKIRSARTVFVNTASSSGEFVKGLAGPGRTIVTATQDRRRAQRDALPGLLRRSVHGRRRGPRSQRPHLGPGGVRLRARQGPAGLRARGLHPERARDARRRRHRRRRQRLSGVGAGARRRDRQRLESGAARRARREAPARGSDRRAEAAQAEHAGGRVRQGAREAGHRAGAEIADDPAARRQEVKSSSDEASSGSRRSSAGWPLLTGATVLAQRRGGFGPPQASLILPNTPYDGKFTFVRLRYGPPVSYASQRVMWSHDYPTGERNFMRMMNELTYLAPHIEETNIMSLDDPGAVQVSARLPVRARLPMDRDAIEEAANFRAYLLKGGFLIVDDFRCPRLAVLRGADAAHPARCPLLRPRRDAPDLSFVLRDRCPGRSTRTSTTRASRSSAASTRTTIRPSG